MDEAERGQLFGISMQEQMARLSWTGAEFDEARTIGLRSLLATARARSSWHAERLAGLDLERVGVADLAGLPVMTKADLMGSFDRIVTAPGLSLARLEDHVSRAGSAVELVDGEYLVLASGGSSGRRAVFPFTVPEAATYFASLLRFSVQWRSRQHLDLGVIATVTAGTSTHATGALTQLFPRPEERHAFPITTPLEEIVEGLNRVQPALLVAYPSALAILAAEQVAGRLRISPALDFERCARVIRHGRDPGDDVARHEPQREPVRVVKNDRVVDCQIERGCSRHGGSQRTRSL